MKSASIQLISIFLTSCSIHGFTIQPTQRQHNPMITSPSSLNAKKNTKKKSSSSSTGLKGFGSSTKSSTTNSIDIKLDKSQKAMDFYTYLENNNAGKNLKRVALGFFPLDGKDENGDPVSLRGVVALQKIKKGEIIIEIPYEAAWNLGREGSDPTLPGSMVLQEYCAWLNQSNDERKQRRDLGPYLSMLPPFNSFDVLSSTDFFSDDALDMLQSPQIKEETLARREKTIARFTRDIKPMMEISSNMYKWADENKITEKHLRWAVWLVTSRVLTVQGEAGTGESYRLMIPLIDMCNHDRESAHVLTGRAVPGGTLKVLAGKTVEIGEQINIVYGGGVSGNDRFIQDYGFLDSFCMGKADEITAKIFLGKTRIVEGSGAKHGRPMLMPEDERIRALNALDETTLEEDESLLMSTGQSMPNDLRSGLEYRIGAKKAL
mmetsp:Transcript_24212/g.28048  ORF Transcript_24212/g.28048 Transcript_24212/m.28048 type:complete len:434 (+) Transcript_24212:178-1479(+)